MNKTDFLLTIVKDENRKKNSLHNWGIILILLLYCCLSTQNVYAVPAAITDLTAEKSSQIKLTWTAPENGFGNTCGSYVVKYSTSGDIINESEFLNATTYYQSWVPLAPGNTETKTLTGLIPDTTYWFSIKSSSGTTYSAISSTGTNYAISGTFYLVWSSAETNNSSSISLGKYMIRPSIRATSFVVTKVYPQIFTPDCDNRNDYVEFQYDNPLDGNPFGRIYDLKGALVSELKKGSNYNSFTWDGRTMAGDIARPGAYVYQIEITGSETKVINGVVILAK